MLPSQKRHPVGPTLRPVMSAERLHRASSRRPIDATTWVDRIFVDRPVTHARGLALCIRVGHRRPERSDAVGTSLLRSTTESNHEGGEVELHTVEQMRCFLCLLLGEDWEISLILANAIAGPEASDEEVCAAQRRAVDLVREKSRWWKEDLSELVAEAWLTLWLEARPWREP